MPRDLESTQEIVPAVSATKIFCTRVEVFTPIHRSSQAAVAAQAEIPEKRDDDGNITQEYVPAVEAVPGWNFGDPIIEQRKAFFDYVTDDNREYRVNGILVSDLAAGEGVDVQTAHDAVKTLAYSATALGAAVDSQGNAVGLPSTGSIV